MITVLDATSNKNTQNRRNKCLCGSLPELFRSSAAPLSSFGAAQEANVNRTLANAANDDVWWLTLISEASGIATTTCNNNNNNKQ